MSSELMSTAEYAAHRGCSDSYIRRMRRLGNLVLHADGKRIQVKASDALLDDITDPVRGGDRTQPPGDAAGAGRIHALGSDVPSVQEAVRRERLARARLAELELGQQSRELTRVKEVERAVFTLVREALNGLQGISTRLRVRLAAETDVRAIDAMLDAEVRAICAKMQKSAARLLADPNQPADAAPDDADEQADQAA